MNYFDLRKLNYRTYRKVRNICVMCMERIGKFLKENLTRLKIVHQL